MSGGSWGTGPGQEAEIQTEAGLPAEPDGAASGRRDHRGRVRPRGWRPAPSTQGLVFDRDNCVGGWTYLTDDGLDPAGRVLPHRVAGVWDTAHEVPAHFLHNPAYGAAPEERPAEGPAAPVPPLHAGRRPAGRALLDWLEDPRAPRLCRIAGSSGSGRTHLLNWLTAACPPDNPRTARRIQLALSVEGLTVRSATWLVAERLGLAARNPRDLMLALQDGVPRTLVVTDLDRAGGDVLPGMPERIAAELLTPLLRIPWLKLLVECASGTPAAAALSRPAPGEAVLDLDDPQWTDPARYAAWCATLPGRPVDPSQVHPSPGLAVLAARTAAAPALDPAAPAGDRAVALAAAWWAGLPGHLRPAVAALAAAGRPLTGEEWSSLPDTGGPAAVQEAAAHVPVAADGRWRLTPQQLADEVAKGMPPIDHAGLLRGIASGVPWTDEGRPDLAMTDPGWLGLLLRHALFAGAADQLLPDPDFLVHAEPAAVTAAFEHLAPTAGTLHDFAEAWERSAVARLTTATPAERAATLGAWLTGRQPEAADRCAELSGQSWRTAWWARQGNPRGNGLDDVRLDGLAVGGGPYQGLLVLNVGGTLRFLDPETGRDDAAHPLERSPAGSLNYTFGDNGTLFVLKADGTVDNVPYGGAGSDGLENAVLRACRTFDGGLTALDILRADLGQLLVTGDGDGGVALVRLDEGSEPITPDTPLHDGAVTCATAALVDGEAVVLTGGEDGRVRMWMPGRELQPPVDSRDTPVRAVAVAGTPAGLQLAAAWADGLVRIHRWGATPAQTTTVDLRLGLPAVGLAADPSGRIHLALPEGVLAITLQ